MRTRWVLPGCDTDYSSSMSNTDIISIRSATSVLRSWEAHHPPRQRRGLQRYPHPSRPLLPRAPPRSLRMWHLHDYSPPRKAQRNRSPRHLVQDLSNQKESGSRSLRSRLPEHLQVQPQNNRLQRKDPVRIPLLCRGRRRASRRLRIGP